MPSFTLAGQLASFIDKGEGGLGLSWKEATEEIPYELILLMQRDKAHAENDDNYYEVEDEEAFFKYLT